MPKTPTTSSVVELLVDLKPPINYTGTIVIKHTTVHQFTTSCQTSCLEHIQHIRALLQSALHLTVTNGRTQAPVIQLTLV